MRWWKPRGWCYSANGLLLGLPQSSGATAMSPSTENFVLEYLRAIRSFDGSAHRGHAGGQIEAPHYSRKQICQHSPKRLDRMDERVPLVEKRLEMVDVCWHALTPLFWQTWLFFPSRFELIHSAPVTGSTPAGVPPHTIPREDEIIDHIWKNCPHRPPTTRISCASTRSSLRLAAYLRLGTQGVANHFYRPRFARGQEIPGQPAAGKILYPLQGQRTAAG